MVHNKLATSGEAASGKQRGSHVFAVFCMRVSLLFVQVGYVSVSSLLPKP